MTSQTEPILDGNAAAGALREVFAVDVTAATGQCVECGNTGPLGGAHLYAQAPGLVVRCPNCSGVLIRLVAGPGRTWLDLRGLSYVEFVTPESP